MKKADTTGNQNAIKVSAPTHSVIRPESQVFINLSRLLSFMLFSIFIYDTDVNIPAGKEQKDPAATGGFLHFVSLIQGKAVYLWAQHKIFH